LPKIDAGQCLRQRVFDTDNARICYDRVVGNPAGASVPKNKTTQGRQK